MNLIKIVYISSLFLLCMLILFGLNIVHMPFTESTGNYTVLSQDYDIIEVENYTAIQFRIKNYEKGKLNYSYKVLVNESVVDKRNITVIAGGTYLSVHYFYPEKVGNGNVTILIYKEGELDPIDHITFPLSFKNSIA